MSTKTETFITKANIIHHNKYDYSLVDYINNSTNVTIICPIHGQFHQRPGNHLSGAQCKECSKINRAITNLEKYGHPNIAQGIKKKKISNTNIDRYGTPQSAKSLNNITKRKQTLLDKYGADNPSNILLFQEKRKQTWLHKYGANNPSNVLLFQEKRKQTMEDRYGGYWTQYHITDVIQLLTDYDWMFDQYITQWKTTIEIANNLGINCTTVNTYLKKLDIEIKQYCGFSYKCVKWLESIAAANNINILHALNGGEYNIPNTKFKADGFCKENNTIYEFHGDVFHGNPALYEPQTCCHPYSNSTAGELYQKTIEREEKIKQLGYNLVVMWEGDFDNSPI